MLPKRHEILFPKERVDSKYRKTKLEQSKKKQREYIESFTVHGLTRVLVGSRIESLIWLLILTGGITLSTFVIIQLVGKYLTYEVNSIIRHKATDKNTFPSLAICEKDLLLNAYFAFCGVPLSEFNVNRNCSNIKPYVTNTTMGNEKWWSNGIFNVTLCQSWDGHFCLNEKYFKSVTRHNNSCIVFNPNGTFSDIYSHVVIGFDIHRPSYVKKETQTVILPFDSRVHEIDVTASINIMPWKVYSVVLEKTFIERLPAPYASNCSEDKDKDIFPGKYTRRQCVESYTYLHIYQTCGAVYDYHRQFMDKVFLDKYKKKQNTTEQIKCMLNQANEKQIHFSECNFPCHEIDVSTVTHFYEDPSVKPNNKTKNDTYRYKIDLSYRLVDTYTQIEEAPRYTWDQVLSEIGGFLGLVIGASVISLFEILACITIKLFSFFENMRLVRRKRSMRYR